MLDDGLLAAFLAAAAHERGEEERVLDDGLAPLFAAAAHERGEEQGVLDDGLLAPLLTPGQQRCQQERPEGGFLPDLFLAYAGLFSSGSLRRCRHGSLFL